MTVQAIIRKSFTVTLTFTGVPSVELRKDMLAKGFAFKNGQWVYNEAESRVTDEANVGVAIKELDK